MFLRRQQASADEDTTATFFAEEAPQVRVDSGVGGVAPSPAAIAREAEFEREEREETRKTVYVAIASTLFLLLLTLSLMAYDMYDRRSAPIAIWGKFASRAEFERRASPCYRPASDADLERWADTRIACDAAAGCTDLGEVWRALALASSKMGLACTTFPKSANASWPCACAFVVGGNETLFFLDPRLEAKSRALAPGTYAERIHAFGGQRVATRIPEWIDGSAARWPDRGRRTFRLRDERAVLFLRSLFFLGAK